MKKYLQSLVPKKKNFALSPEEKVLLQMNPLRSETSKIAFISPMSCMFFVFLSITIICFIWVYMGIDSSNDFSSMIVWMIAGTMAFIPFCFLVIIIYQQYEKRQTYYVTDRRIVKKYPNNSYKEFSYKDVAYIFDGLTSLNIYSKGPNSEIFYTGTETEYIHSTIGKPKLIFRLGTTNHFIILDLLAKMIPLKIHPNLERIYIRKETIK